MHGPDQADDRGVVGMSFPAYPEYKNTEIPWMQRIPSSWQLLPFFSRFFERKESNKGMKSENLLSLSYGRIVRKDITTLEGLLPASFETYQVVHPGNIVFRLTDLQNDKRSLRSAIVNGKGIITSAYLAVSAKDFNPTFSNYLFRAYDLMKVFYSMGGGLRQSMKYDDMKWLPIVCPSINEQTQIARFLDHETAKIDALIREQERLIALLQEKRQAVISHAVTKGLDPDVPMKDSGVEWLGEVPAHWDIVAIKWLSPVLRGASPRPIDDPIYFDDQGEYAWVRIADVSASNGVLTNTTQQLSGLGASLSVKLEPGAMFLSIAGTVGKPCITKIKACIHDGFVYFPRLEIPPKFLYRVFESGLCYGGLGKMGTQLNLNTETVGGIKIGVPPIQEIEEILVFVSDRLSRFDGLIEEAKLASSLLQERRSALISAAVTGKIDVRDWQPPADESAFDEEVRQAGMETTA